MADGGQALHVDCPALHQSFDENTLVIKYFQEGYTYPVILTFLQRAHGLEMTLDQLRGVLRKLGLKRRGDDVQSPIDDVERAIQVLI